MASVSRTDIEAARDAALLCLDATLHVWLELAFGWATAKMEGPQAFEEFDRHAQQVIVHLDALRRRAEETTPPAVRQAILEANVANPPVEWAGTRYVTAHDATIYIAKCLVHVIAMDAEAPDLFSRWEASCARMTDHEYMPPWSVQLTDIEKEAAATLVTLRTPRASCMDPDSANNPNTSRLFSGDLPENPDIIDLVCRLDAARETGKSQVQIAREFTGEETGSDPKAQSLLAQIRRLKNQGRITL